MWCDNCLLLFPLRGGAIAWGTLIFLYSVAGGVFLLMRGQFFFFTYPEWQIYGGIGVGVGSCALINVIALSNRSYLWTRVCKFLWPFVIIISGIRAVVMVVELNRGKSNITWECQHGGQLWPGSSVANSSTTPVSMPETFCGPGFSSLFSAFIICLLADIGCQIYMYFLNWRFTKRIEHYTAIKGITYGDI